jgi:putative DNA primase/helicase
MRSRDDDLGRLKADLQWRAQEIAHYYLGEPASRSRVEWRWGSKGSKCLRLAQGSFQDFEADDGGSLIDLIRIALGITFPEAVQEARKWTSGDDLARPRAKPPQATPKAVQDEAEAKATKARKLYEAGRPIASTPAEAYLAWRGIEHGTIPDARHLTGATVKAVLPWWWTHSALVLPVTTAAGEVRAVQLIALNADGTVARRSKDGGKLKITLGDLRSGVLRIPGDPQGPLVLAEGAETAASCAQSTGWETWAALGSVGRVAPESLDKARHVIIAADDDPRVSPARKKLNSTIRQWQRAGINVSIAQPWELSRGDKTDFNDALIEAGPEAVREALRKALGRDTGQQAGMPVADARAALELAMARFEATIPRKPIRFLGEELAMPGTVRAVRVSTGVGKTRAALDMIARMQKFEQISVATPVFYAVPSHKLAEELLTRARKDHGIESVEVWRGREAINPATGEPMCSDLDAVKDALAVGARVQTSVCKFKGRQCRFFDRCAYQKQRKRDAVLWIGAHELLIAGRPSAIKPPAFVVIDEDSEESFLTGVDGRPTLVNSEMLLRKPWAVNPDTGKFDDDKTAGLRAELMPMRKAVAGWLRTTPLGYVPATAAIDIGLASEDLARAISSEYSCAKYATIVPNMQKDDRAQVIRDYNANNPHALRLAKMWQYFRDLLELGDSAATSGNLEVVEATDAETGLTYRALRLQGRKRLSASWGESPDILALSATLRPDLLEHALGQPVEMLADINAAAPHQRIVQHTGKSFSHSNLHALRSQQDKPLPAAAEKLRDAVWSRATLLHRQNGGTTLLIVPKTVEEWLRTSKTIPTGMELAHHGALAGVDAWKAARTVVIVGRMMPSPQAVERIAAALTGVHKPIETDSAGWYATSRRTVQDKQGRVSTIDLEATGDAIADEVLSRVSTDQAIQALGRARGVNRNDADPVEIHLLGAALMEGEPVDELIAWQNPTPEEAYVAEFGLYFENSSHMAKAMGADREAVKKARSRADSRWGHSPIDNSYTKMSPSGFSSGKARSRADSRSPLSLIDNSYTKMWRSGFSGAKPVRYRIDKPRHGWTTVHIFGDAGDIRKRLETVLGEAIEIETAPDPDPIPEAQPDPGPVTQKAPSEALPKRPRPRYETIPRIGPKRSFSPAVRPGYAIRFREQSPTFCCGVRYNGNAATHIGGTLT